MTVRAIVTGSSRLRVWTAMAHFFISHGATMGSRAEAVLAAMRKQTSLDALTK